MSNQDTEGSKCVEERPKWNNKAEYLLTCIGFAVGLGNVWRFPYLCQIYGGGAFLIPYFIALVFQGLPLLYLELAIGQRLRTGSIGVWNSISPYLGGVGIASLVVSFCVSLFYNTIVAWVLWYLFNSFQEPLPWSQCPLNINNTGFEEECVESTPVNYFWYRETLNISPNIETSGSLQWWLVVCLATAWCIVYICFIRGIETIGKAVYVTATFPYLVLTIFLVRALILPGATDGLKHLFTPKWDILLNPQVWLDAATQIFFSLSLAFGGLISFSSYNHQKNDCERDAIVVGVINSATSIYASIPIFAILGFKAHTNFVTCLNDNILALTNDFEISDMNITIDNYDQWFDYLNTTHTEKVSNLHLKTCNMQDFLDQSASGTGLAFIVFTEVVISMPASQVWAVLFFIMLFSLGLSSMFGNLEGVLSPIHDLKLIPEWIPRELFTGNTIICTVSFLVALIFTMGSGNYWLEIFNGYVGSVPLLIIAFFETIAVVYVYGIRRFSDDLEFMTGRRPNIFWKVCWLVISPLMLLVVLVAYVAVQIQTNPTYPAWNPKYEKFPNTEVQPYPDWVFAICVLLSSVPVMSIPMVAIYRLICRLAGRRSTSIQNVNSIDQVYSNVQMTVLRSRIWD
uniref:Transporter n=1 Tax=Esox lucius TaxID=8010 RepID=A0A6Q2ZKM1_ESOLU